MCRLFASVGPEGPPSGELLAFRGQCTTGCGGPHGDGWGVVGYAAPRIPAVLGKGTLPALRDEAFEAAAARAEGHGVVLAHLRKASVGAKHLDNTHPFVQGPWAFMHNGTVKGGYEERVAPGRGLNDSRALFHRALRFIRQGQAPGAALRSTVREVQAWGHTYTSLILVLTDGQGLWATREAPERLDEYTLRHARAGERFVLCQDPVLALAWQEVPNHTLLSVEGGALRVEPLGPGGAERPRVQGSA